MGDTLNLAWDPKRLSSLHEAVTTCARCRTPVIRSFHGGDLLRLVPEATAVFPSAFNPPTVAHEAIVDIALKDLGFHEVMLLLDVHHADKPPEDALLEDRALMMTLDFAGDHRLILSLSSHGRFLDKLQALPRGEGWTFLVGLDTMERILQPIFYKDPERELSVLFSRAAFVVFQRGDPKEDLEEKMERWTRRGAKMRSARLPEELGVVSSSMVRENINTGKPIGGLVSPRIEAFIKETGLYLPYPSLYLARKMVLNELFQGRLRTFTPHQVKGQALRVLEGFMRDS